MPMGAGVRVGDVLAHFYQLLTAMECELFRLTFGFGNRVGNCDFKRQLKFVTD